jgi:hypothetical protein
MKTPPDDDPFPEPALRLVFDLLRGRTDDVPTDVYSRIHYLTPDEQRAGRRALAELLRTRKRPGPSRGGLSITELRERMLDEACHQLADLIDPSNTGPRQIVFTNPQGQPPQPFAKLKIFRSVEMLLKEDEQLLVTEAIEKVAEKHKRSTRWVWDIWRDFRTEE